MVDPAIQLNCTITCPKCGALTRETMPTDSCRWFYECPACGELLRPEAGDCCVFCSFGSVKCPPIQAGGKCCEWSAFAT
ncbi:MAG: GDCCVxC domain-containing (seleno)protein [Methyloligellaceae bacterium]